MQWLIGNRSSMYDKPEVAEATSSKSSSKLERTSSKDSRNDSKSECMVETRDKGDPLPEHSSTAALVKADETQDTAAGHTPVASVD